MPAVTSPIATVEWFDEAAVATITVTELSLDQGLDDLAHLLDELIYLGARHLVLDVQCVQFMDSACLRCLLETFREISTAGGRIALVNPNQTVQYLVKLTRLHRVFPLCGDVMSALASVERHSIGGVFKGLEPDEEDAA